MQKFKKDQVNLKLKTMGWRIPEGIQYKGMLESHAVQCVKCGWIQEKRLDNLMYRHEECPMCGNGVFEDSMQQALDDLKTAFREFKFEVIEQLKPKVEEPVVTTGVLETGFSTLKTLFNKYISKTGFVQYGRKINSDEWFELSFELAEQLMLEVSDNEQQFFTWTDSFNKLSNDYPNKQGQDLLFAVVPPNKFKALEDAITKRVVKM